MPVLRAAPAGVGRNDPARVGIGWRHPHYEELLDSRPEVGFLEVHSENFFGAGGAALAMLERGRERYPVSLHGVGLSLGSVVGVDERHLQRLAALVMRIEPQFVSDHACFARAPVQGGNSPIHAADLLPLPFSQEALDVLCRNVQHVQDRLRRPLLIENLSSYVPCPGNEMSEVDFLATLTRRTGCKLLLDLNNLYVNARNAFLRGDEGDPLGAARAAINGFSPDQLGEIHLAGHCEVDADGVRMVIDDHGSRVGTEVWQLYEHAFTTLGPVPTLIEWDNNVPTLDVLLDEARRARVISGAGQSKGRQ